ncbi:MAG TPA: hypothetical protein VGO67_17135 [Verrucomicrobiae bacterium]|jgi:hypothetical protein
MKIRTVLGVGFFGGIFVGGAVTLLEVAPTATAILMTPLKWLIGGSHPYPSGSSANFALALPLMFIYWGGLGVFVSLLLFGAFGILKSRRQNGDEHPAQTKK